MVSRRALRISNRLSFPTDFATKSLAILSQRRKGKTYTASVMAEECVACEIPFVALDPTGAWWGLRASADGKSEGLPVYVFGGQHASDPDMKLERTAGKEIARFVVDYPGYYVIDFKSFESKAAEREFATDFGEELYAYKQRRGNDFVQHVFVDEADMFVPQERSGIERMLGAYESIVRRGGILGLGTTLISQRTAIVNKNVLEQIDTLIVLRTVGPNDQDAIRRYAKANGTPEQMAELMASMASLRLGEAWIYEPGADPPLFERVQIRERTTFNSSATPKPGEKRIEPKALSKVERDALRERMAASFEKAKAEDVPTLQKTIKRLERELATAAKTVETKTVEKVVKVEVVPPAIAKAVTRLTKQLRSTSSQLGTIGDEMSSVCTMLDELAQAKGATNGHMPDQGLHVARGARGRAHVPGRAGADARDRPVRRAHGRDVPAERLPGDAAGEIRLGAGERATLIAVVQYDAGVTPEQLTILTGYKRSSRNTYIQRLGAAGLVERRGDRIFATDTGVELLGDDYEPLPTGEALREYWLNKLGGGERAILSALMDAYPDGLSPEELSERTNYTKSSRNTYIQRLGARGLVRRDAGDIVCTDVLFEGDA